MSASRAVRIAGWIVFGLAMGVLLAFLLGLVVMSLWNWLLPPITNGAVTTITYWQAVGLFVLCHLLFKSHHEGPGHHHGDRGKEHFLARKIHGLVEGSEGKGVESHPDHAGAD